MSADQLQHSIGEMARLAGVTPRTIRYYVAQGLLPPPSGVGPGAHYGPGHLERLLLIRRLQRQHLPLSEIRSRLAELTDEQVTAMNRAETSAPARPADSALDYIRSVLGAPRTTGAAGAAGAGATEIDRSIEPLVPSRPLPAPSLKPALPPRRPAGSALLAMRSGPSLVGEPPGSAPTQPTAAPQHETTLERSQWERLSLGPNLELHVRRPLSRHEQRRVERLITIARQVLKEEMP